jgi:hypothetical protein
MKFSTILSQTGGNTTGIIVPQSIVEAFAAGKKPPVIVTINGHSYRSSIAVMGGEFMVGVSSENRLKAGVKGGEEVEVEIVLDDQPRVVEIPADVALALKSEPTAAEFFEKLSYSHKRRHILVIEDAKTPETRARRIEKAVEMLKLGKK